MTQYLTFLIQGEVYAMNLADIPEIADATDIIKVSGQPGYICGVAAAMGGELPVLDLKYVLKNEKNKRTTGCVLIADIEGVKAGFAVDKVDEAVVLGERDSLPEYFTVLDTGKLLDAEQIKMVRHFESQDKTRKRARVKPPFKREARNLL